MVRRPMQFTLDVPDFGARTLNYENYGDSAFNYRSAGAMPEILDFSN